MLPEMVTRPGFVGCLNWLCPPLDFTWCQPSLSTSRIASRTLVGTVEVYLGASAPIRAHNGLPLSRADLTGKTSKLATLAARLASAAAFQLDGAGCYTSALGANAIRQNRNLPSGYFLKVRMKLFAKRLGWPVAGVSVPRATPWRTTVSPTTSAPS